MWTWQQLGAAQEALAELRLRASASFSYTRGDGDGQRSGIEQVLRWVSHMEIDVLPNVMSQFYATSLTYERFVSALGENHSQISLIDGQIKETSIYSTAKRFVGEVAAQTAVDVGSGVKQAAVATANAVPEIAKGVVSSLPWIAIGLGALALLYVAKVVRP